MLYLIIYILGIGIIFLIKKYSGNKNKGWYMWAVYLIAVFLGAMNFSWHLWGEDRILVWAFSTIFLVALALVILRFLVKKFVKTPDHQEDYLFFPLEPDNNMHSSDTKKASL